MTESWIDKYEYSEVVSNSLAMEVESNNIPYASQIGSGRIVTATQFDMEMYFEGGAEDDLLCLVCFMAGRDEQKSHLRLSERGIRKGFFQHVNERHHSEEEVWRVWTIIELTERIKEQNPSLIIENGTLDEGSYDGDILASSTNVNVAVEVQSNYALKRDIRKRNGIYRNRKTLDQWIYPPHVQPEIFMKDTRNLVAGTGDKSLLGYYVMSLKVTSKISGEPRVFNLSVNDESLVRKLSSAKPFDFERVRVLAVLANLEEWSFGQEGFTPSWGTSAFDIKQHFADEIEAFNDFMEKTHHPKTPSSPVKAALPKPKKVATARNALKSPLGASNTESEAVVRNYEPEPELTRGRLLWFTQTYFRYETPAHQKASRFLAEKIDMDTLRGVIKFEEEWVCRAKCIGEQGFFWQISKSEDGVVEYSILEQWKSIIVSMSNLHQVSSEGKTKKTVNPVLYTGEKTVEAVVNLVGEFKASLN